MFRHLCFFAFLILPFNVFSQWQWTLIENDGFQDLHAKNPRSFPCKDKADCYSSVESFVEELRSDGHLIASIDSIREDDEQLIALVFIGPKAQKVFIEDFDSALYEELPFKTKDKWRKESGLSFSKYQRLRENLLDKLENNGYPFGSIGFEPSEFESASISGSLTLNKGPLVLIDTLRISGSSKVKQRFLEGVLGLESGSFYNEQRINDVRSVIGNLDYLSLVSGPDVTFQSNDEAQIDLLIDDRSASSFDVILGLLPNSSRNDGFLVTGQILLDLRNPFGTGKRFYLNWNRLEERAQEFKLNLSLPYLFRTPIGFDGGLEMYKFDSLYLDLDWNVGLRFQFTGNSYVSAFAKGMNTFVLNVDSNLFIGEGLFPTIQDLRNNHFGLSYEYSSLDFRPSPREGVLINAFAAGGIRTIKRNEEIEQLVNPNTDETYGEIYNRSDLRTGRAEIGLDVRGFVPVGLRHVFFMGFRSRALIAKDIFFNEKYRVGGTQLLRGFNEESLFTAYYAVATVEYRFLFSRSSFFYLFLDQGGIESQAVSTRIDYPTGFGAGISLETKAGWFSVSYALGRKEDENINFGASKIHFGYLNRF